MSYFQAKSDLKFIIEFHNLVRRFWEMEARASENVSVISFLLPWERQAALQAEATKIDGYQEHRRKIAKKILRAERIASRLGVPIIFESYPPPAVGGPIIRQKMFSAILSDASHGELRIQTIYDAINQTIGEYESRVSREFRRFINPLYWIKELVVVIIRIPFMIIEASGFDVSKVEDHFIGRFFKLLEIGFIVYILLRLGIEKESIQQILIKLFKR